MESGEDEQYLAELLGRIREAMRAKGLSEADLARGLGAHRSVPNQWFTRGNRPSLRYLKQLPRELGVSAEWLLTGSGPRHRADAAGGEAFEAGVRAVLSDVAELEGRIRAKYLDTAAATSAGQDPASQVRQARRVTAPPAEKKPQRPRRKA